MQRKIYDMIVAFKRVNRNSPTYSEIASAVHISRTWAWHVVRKLVEAGKLEVISGRVCVVGGRWSMDTDFQGKDGPVGGSRR